MAKTKTDTESKRRNLGGRPPKYTPEEFAKKMDEFFQYCMENNVPPVNYAISSFLGISADTLERYRKGDTQEGVTEDDRSADTYKGFGGTIKKLDAFREYFYAKIMLDNPKATGGPIFALKQRQNGGWTDKGDDRKDVAITVKIDAGSKDPFA